jgi:hypothetical protein
MKIPSILFCCLSLCLLSAGASAYTITFSIPAELDAGNPLVVQGTSNLPAGATVDVQLFRDVPNFQSKLITALSATVQQDGSWEVIFETTGFVSGTYKVELPPNPDYPYGSSSVQLRTVTITGTDPVPTIASPPATAFTPSPPPSPGQTVKEVGLDPTRAPAPVAMILLALCLGAALAVLRRR